MGYLQPFQKLYVPCPRIPCLHKLQSSDVHQNQFKGEINLPTSTFPIHYKPGVQNVEADALSRFPIEMQQNMQQRGSKTNI